MNDAASKTLALVAELLGSATGDWWVITGAALAMHGGGDKVRDVDLLLGDRDAFALFARLGLPANPGVPDHRFRSRLFARWTKPPLPVELMAGLDVRASGEWVPLAPRTRERFEVNGAQLFAPSLVELRHQLRLFGRPKDLRRAAALGG